jgi:hypothetical protein
MRFLYQKRVLLTGFKEYAQETTKQLKEASLEQAEAEERPVIYLPSSRDSKEELAREIAERDNVKEGLIAVLTALEPCTTYEIVGNRDTKRREIHLKRGKCLHLYHYQIHPVLGFMGARIQTWFPFTIHVTINGREWLARDLDRAGISYQRADNCYPWIEDVPRAQKIMDRQLRRNWKRLLDSIARTLNPAHGRIFRGAGLSYYWSVSQSEWATDIMFHTQRDLDEIWHRLVTHTMTNFTSADVMRFLGKKVSASFQGQIVTDFKDRPEGIRIRSRVDDNSAKAYDKPGNLRAETTMNNPTVFSVFRPKEGDPDGPKKWRPLRKGIADLHRRAQVSQEINDRYLDALSAADTDRRVGDLLRAVSSRTRFKKRSVRALRPTASDDLALLRLIASGDHAAVGLRNRDVQRVLFPKETRDPKERRRRSAKATRLLRLLRAHGLIRKKPHTHRYAVTPKGMETAAAALASQSVTVKQLIDAA